MLWCASVIVASIIFLKSSCKTKHFSFLNQQSIFNNNKVSLFIVLCKCDSGINNFFKGYDSLTMEINEKLADTKYVAGATIDSETGTISQGDNTNALAMADVQFQEQTFKLWTFNRGSEAQSSTTTTSLDNY